MSASTEKKNRKAALEAGTAKKSAAKLEAEKAAAKSRRNWIIGIAIFAVVVIIAIILNSGIISTAGTGVKVNGQKVSPAEAGYYVSEQREMYSQYAQMYASYGLSMGEMSEEEYVSYGLEELARVKALCSFAAENGITLDESDIKKVNDSMASIKLQVIAAQSFSSVDNYYEYRYGTGVDSKLVEKILLEQALADKAYQAKSDSLVYTDEELDAKYAEYNGTKDKFDHLYYYVAAAAEGAADENTEPVVTEEALAEAKKTADAIAAGFKAGEAEDIEERFNIAIADEGIIAGCSVGDDVLGSSLDSSYSEWMMDSARKEGDCNVAVDSASKGYYVTVFLSRSCNDYNTVSMRHILIKAIEDENGEFTDEAKAVARGEAMAIYNEWKNGAATEDSFAELANKESVDTGSNNNGGLYEGIYRGQMVPEISDWIFGDRKPGDVEVIDVESSNYTGTHVVYFVGEGMRYDRMLAKQDLSNDALSTWIDELCAAFAAEKGWAYAFIGK